MSGIKVTEVKLMLESAAALQDGFKLSDDLISYFNVKRNSEEMRIWYVDTPEKRLQSENWIVRYRYHEGCDFELTFKKRYGESEYKALPAEQAERFTAFKPQIDMSVSKKTYSFAFVKLFKMGDNLYNLEEAEAKRLALDSCPPVFTDWNGKSRGYEQLSGSVLYGPVEAREYKGKYSGVEATFEIWKLGGYLAELSFKADTERSEELMGKLLGDDIIKRLALRDGTLKTEAFFNYYSKQR